jgi:monoamine oxidase
MVIPVEYRETFLDGTSSRVGLGRRRRSGRPEGRTTPPNKKLGALIARFGADVPVTLNCAVERIDWSGRAVELQTPKGTVKARRVLITVSTGVLGAGDIRFDPNLPDWKREAIAGVPMGTHNRIGLMFDKDVFGPDCPEGGGVLLPEEESIWFSFRPFGQPSQWL